MEQKEIDIELQKAASTFKMEVPNDAWPFIADALHQKKKRRFLWLWFLLLLIGIAAAGLYLINTGQNKKGISDKELAKNIIVDNKKDVTNNKELLDNKTSNTNNIESKEIKVIIDENNINKQENKIVNKQNIAKNELRENNKYTIKEIYEIKYKNVTKKATLFTKKVRREKQNIEVEDDEDKSENDIVKIDNTLKYKNTEIENNGDSNTLKVEQSINTKIENKLKDTTKKVKLIRKKMEITKNKKWNFYAGFTFSLLNVKDKNILSSNNTQAERLILNYTFINPITSINKANYYKGRSIAAFILISPNYNKKIEKQFGVQLNYNSFKSKVFSAPAANVYDASGLLRLDTTALSNSFFSDKALNGGSSVNIKNNNFQLGIIAGVKFNLYKINKSQNVKLQIQLIPNLNFTQYINWFDRASGRYFIDKKLNTVFNVNQSTSILWEVNKNKKTISIGPNFNFNMFKLNKTITNLSNIYTNSFGLQVQIKLN